MPQKVISRQIQCLLTAPEPAPRRTFTFIVATLSSRGIENELLFCVLGDLEIMIGAEKLVFILKITKRIPCLRMLHVFFQRGVSQLRQIFHDEGIISI